MKKILFTMLSLINFVYCGYQPMTYGKLSSQIGVLCPGVLSQLNFGPKVIVMQRLFPGPFSKPTHSSVKLNNSLMKTLMHPAPVVHPITKNNIRSEAMWTLCFAVYRTMTEYIPNVDPKLIWHCI